MILHQKCCVYFWCLLTSVMDFLDIMQTQNCILHFAKVLRIFDARSQWWIFWIMQTQKWKTTWKDVDSNLLNSMLFLLSVTYTLLLALCYMHFVTFTLVKFNVGVTRQWDSDNCAVSQERRDFHIKLSFFIHFLKPSWLATTGKF